MLSEAMNNPMMQSLLNNPELMRTMIQSNPMVREVGVPCCYRCRREAVDLPAF